MDFTIQKYDAAMRKFMEEVVDGFMSVDPLFGSFSKVPIVHRGPIRNVRGDTPFDQKLSRTSGRARLTREAIRDTDFDKYTEFLYELAQSNKTEMAPLFFEGISELTEIVGNTINAHGLPFSFDQLLDALEKIEFSFDDKDDPIMPTLHLNPETYKHIKDLKPTPEQEQRSRDILARKKAEHLAQKRTRRLS
jgi:hypothetical protein